MVQMKESQDIDWNKWYDFLGQMDIPTIHLGGVKATRDLLALCEITEKSEVLVIGCGTGYTVCEIAQKYDSHVVGIDISGDMIARAQKRARKYHLENTVEFQIADVFELPFDDEAFDVVIVESVLNVLPGNKRDALIEMKRILKKDGLIGANEDFALPETPDDILARLAAVSPVKTFFTPQRLKGLFEDSGFDIVHLVENPATDVITPKEVVTLIKTVGLVKLLSFSVRLLLDSDIREIGKYYREGSAIMIKGEDTRDFFGYALIVGKKREPIKGTS
ncbi:MAG: class I SAM-dependent methyltransferase [Theionarchaea archaeon]|nr:class I SAM-dependent methyltransferase [Theionarchaea archaeon]